MFESIGTLTTAHGIKWDITTLNGRAAYQRDQLTILWLANINRYAILNAMANMVMSGSLQECLDAVRFDVN